MFNILSFTFVFIGGGTFFISDYSALLLEAWYTLVLVGCGAGPLVCGQAFIYVDCVTQLFGDWVADLSVGWSAPKKLIYSGYVKTRINIHK